MYVFFKRTNFFFITAVRMFVLFYANESYSFAFFAVNMFCITAESFACKGYTRKLQPPENSQDNKEREQGQNCGDILF